MTLMAKEEGWIQGISMDLELWVQILQKFFAMISNLYCFWRYHRNSFMKGTRCRMDTKGVLFLVKCFLTWIPLHSASNYLEILDNAHHIVEIYVTQYISRHAYYCLNWRTLSEYHIQAQNCWKWYIYVYKSPFNIAYTKNSATIFCKFC